MDEQPQTSAMAELLHWQPVSAGLPDAETNVLLALADGTTCEGFYDGHWEQVEGEPPLFRDVCADPLDVDVVIAWSEMPRGPARASAVTPLGAGEIAEVRAVVQELESKGKVFRSAYGAPAADRVDPTACPECVGSGTDLDGGSGQACAKCDGTGDAGAGGPDHA